MVLTSCPELKLFPGIWYDISISIFHIFAQVQYGMFRIFPLLDIFVTGFQIVPSKSIDVHGTSRFESGFERPLTHEVDRDRKDNWLTLTSINT